VSKLHPYFQLKMTTRTLLAGVLFILVFSSISRGDDFEGLDSPWMQKVPCKDDPDKRSIIALGASSVICYDFDAKELTPGAPPQTLAVTIHSQTGNGLMKVDSLTVVDTGRQPGITISLQSGPRDGGNEVTAYRTYRYSLTLDSNLKAELYQMKLTVSTGFRDENVIFYLPMGAAPQGDWLELTTESQNSIDCWSGSVCSPVNLVFVNKLPYGLVITQTSVFSEPSDLLEPSASTLSQKLKKGLSPQPVSIKPTAKPMTPLRALSGLRVPKAVLHVIYEDQYGREFSKRIPLALEVRPNLALLTVMLLLGAVAGTIVRIDLGRLHKAGVITRKQQVVFAATTFGSGVFVCLIALFANVKLVAFADQNTYSAWDPKMLFLTSLVGTIAGIPILYAWLKLPAGADDNLPAVGGKQPSAGGPPQAAVKEEVN
jgi:hypothetical protein